VAFWTPDTLGGAGTRGWRFRFCGLRIYPIREERAYLERVGRTIELRFAEQWRDLR